MQATKGNRKKIFQTSDITEIPAIFEEDCNIVIWNRALSQEFEEGLKKCQIPKNLYIRTPLQVGGVDLKALFWEESRFRPDPFLLQDIDFLVTMFSDLMGIEEVGLRLANLQSAMCPKFHVDYVGIRLLCTYTGPGTEFLESTEQNKELIKSHNNHNGIQGYQRTNPWDVILLKGEKWEGNENHGAIHRSPEVAPGSNRLVLSLDIL